ncbi:GGDEF domain-containing protein [Deinococcus sp. Marseille-Q6407]|uniref:GGDEF domain-containing protein n=1 Tax=Deinococcus sp. Marseille-Q6407 TaxID=2969223 RepID=UPI0021C0921E|nr:GGDEF domain-containing protein [Deinococcus sp. Marseille-Q6407]
MRRNSQPQERIQRLITAGRWLCNRSSQQAYRFARQAVSEAEQGGDEARPLLAQALNLLGTIEIDLGQQGAARSSFRRAREEALRLGDAGLQIKVANNMALLHHTAGEWHSAAQQFLLAQTLSRRSEVQVPPALASIVQANLANLHSRWGDPERTLHLIDAYHLLDDPAEIVRAHAQLGHVNAHLMLAEQCQRLERLDDREQHLQQAEAALNRFPGLPETEFSYYSGRRDLEAQLLAQRGEADRASDLLREALARLRGQFMDGEIDLQLQLSRLLLQRSGQDAQAPNTGELGAAQQEAENLLQAALTLMDRWGKHYLRLEALELLASLYEQQGRMAEALAVMHRITAELRAQAAWPSPSAELSPTPSDLLAGSSTPQTEWQQRLQLAEDLARQDALTGTVNRRGADEALPGLLQQQRPPAHLLHLMLIDLDHFKQVNDNHSHAMGDRVLCSLAGLLQDVAGLDALTARYGGEEFLVALSGARRQEARRVAEQIRLRTMGLSWEGSPVQVTVSVGLTTAAPHDTVSSLLARADEALYRAKHSGRNRVVELPPGA